MNDKQLREEIDPIEQLYIESSAIGLIEFRKRIVALIKTREIKARKDELLRADGFTEAEYTVKRLAELNKESTQ